MATQQELVGERILTSKSETTPYVLESFIAGGSFGQVYQGVNENTRQQVAVKLERKDAKHRQLYLEFGFYMRLGRNCPYAPRIHFLGSVDNWNALVMDLLGPSLKKLSSTLGKFSAECTAAVGISLLKNFEKFHEKGLIFRDVKPDNFLVGPSNTEEAYSTYLIDLGLAKSWRTEDGEHIPFATGKPLTGTPQYISRNMHQAVELSRRDDLESILYMLIHLQVGTLPWMLLDRLHGNDFSKKMALYSECKQKLPVEEICPAMSHHFRSIFTKVRKLKFDEDPDYEDYIQKLGNILTDRGLSDDDIQGAMDWNSSHQKRPKPNRQRKSSSSQSSRKSKESKGRRNKSNKKNSKRK